RVYLQRRGAGGPFDYVVHTGLDTAGGGRVLGGGGGGGGGRGRGGESSGTPGGGCRGGGGVRGRGARWGGPRCGRRGAGARGRCAPGLAERAARLRELLADGATVARPAIDFDDAEQRWIGLHEAIVDGRHSEPARNGGNPRAADEDQPLVSVCLSHYNRPMLLRQALDSLRVQDYPNYEGVLVDDASTEPAALPYLDRLTP